MTFSDPNHLTPNNPLCNGVVHPVFGMGETRVFMFGTWVDHSTVRDKSFVKDSLIIVSKGNAGSKSLLQQSPPVLNYSAS